MVLQNNGLETVWQRYEITEQRAKNILREKDKILSAIQEKRQHLYGMLADTETAMRSAALPSGLLSDMPSSSGNQRDVGDIYLQYQKQLFHRDTDIRFCLWELADMEEGVTRLWQCYLALPEPYYGILKELYVEGELYQSVEASSGFSHKTFEKNRKTGMDILLYYYQSDMSIERVWHEQKSSKENKPLRKGKTDIQGQLSFDFAGK